MKFLITIEEATKTNCIASGIKALKYYIKTDKAFNNKENIKILFEFFKFSKDTFNNIEDSHNIIQTVELFNNKFNNFKYKNFIMSHLKKDDKDISGLLEYPASDSEKDYDKKTNEFLSKITYKTGKKLVKEIFPDESQYITTYQAKGAEYDSVFVALKPTMFDKREGVNLVEVFKNPDTVNQEFSRILYVACSRAINKLFVYIDCSEIDSKLIIASIENWKKEKGIKSHFYEIKRL